MMPRSLNYPGAVFAVGLLLLSSACTATQTGSSATAANPPASPSQARSAESQVPRMTVEELKKLMAEGQVVVVDVRAADAYKVSHIKGSINLPLEKIRAGEFGDLPRDKRIVTYCSCGTEGSSAAASVLLEKAGYKNSAALLGGTNAWQQSGGEMEIGAAKASS